MIKSRNITSKKSRDLVSPVAATFALYQKELGHNYSKKAKLHYRGTFKVK